MQILVDLAAQFDRKVAFVGRSIVRNAEIAQRLGFLRVPAGIQIRDADVPEYASQDVLCMVTGSQGEPQAALGRLRVWLADDPREPAQALGGRLWVFAAADVAGPWLPPADEVALVCGGEETVRRDVDESRAGHAGPTYGCIALASST